MFSKLMFVWKQLENKGHSLCLDTNGEDAPTELGVSDCLPKDEYDIDSLQVYNKSVIESYMCFSLSFEAH